MPKGVYNRNSEIDTRGEQVGQAVEVDISLVGEPELERSSIEVIENPLQKSYLDQLAFNEEFVDILIHPSNDPNSDPVVQVSVNGIGVAIPRNERVKVKRKYVEVLANAKNTSYTQDLSNPSVPNQYNKLHGSTALLFPFSVLRDDNPQGGIWLQTILAAA